MMRLLGIIGALVAAGILYIMYIAGIFDSAAFEERVVGPYNLVYRQHRGNYQGIRYALNTVYSYVRDKKGDTVQIGFAIFYDDPHKVNQDSLRSIGGVVTDSLLAVEKPYHTDTIPQTSAVVAVFPLRSFFSYVIGYQKVSEELDDYLAEHELTRNGPLLELYDMDQKKILYIVPIGKGPSPLPSFREDR